MIGNIDVYFREKGYGFIVSLQGGRKTYFFHVANILDGAPALDAPVEFEVAPAKTGATRPTAVNIRVKAGV